MKKPMVWLLILCLAVVLVACDTNTERYNSALQQIKGTYPDEPEQDDLPIILVPEEVDGGQKGKAEQVTDNASWPNGVPEVEAYEAKFGATVKDGVFQARYHMTLEQVSVWTDRVGQAGFTGFKGDSVANNGELEVSYTTYALPNTDVKNVVITIRAYNQK